VQDGEVKGLRESQQEVEEKWEEDHEENKDPESERLKLAKDRFEHKQRFCRPVLQPRLNRLDLGLVLSDARKESLKFELRIPAKKEKKNEEKNVNKISFPEISRDQFHICLDTGNSSQEINPK